MKDKIKKATLTTLSGAIIVSNVPLNVFADVLDEVNELKISETEDVLDLDVISEDDIEDEEGSEAEVESQLESEPDSSDVKDVEYNEEIDVDVDASFYETIDTNESSNEPLEQATTGEGIVDKTQVIVEIPDTNLKSTLRSVLNKSTGEITQADMETITTLNLHGKGVKKLNGLEYAVNLTYLNYPHNNSNPDLTPLSQLPNLEELYLNNNSLQSVDALATIVSLKKLNIGGNNIKDISSLSNLVNLERLNLSSQHYSNPIENVGVLKNFKNLTHLYMNSLPTTDVSSIQGLTLLEELEMNGTKATDFSYVSGLTNLTLLKITGSQIDDLSFLENLTDLVTLDLSSNRLNDISSLSKLPNLKYLYLSNNDIEDGTGLINLSDLITLNMDKNDLANIDFISSFPALRYYNFAYNRVTDLTSLQGFKVKPSMQKQLHFIETEAVAGKSIPNPFVDQEGNYMTIEENEIFTQSSDKSQIIFQSNLDGVDLTQRTKVTGSNYTGQFYLNTPNDLVIEDTVLESLLRDSLKIYDRPLRISDLERLTSLNYQNKGIGNVTPLRYATYLTSLYLSTNQISDISQLKYLTDLTDLRLYGNRIVSLEGVEGLTNLTNLELGDNQIQDLSPVGNLSKLKTLHVQKNKIESFWGMEGLSSLTNLTAFDNQISNLEGLKNITSLTSLTLYGNQITDISPLTELVNLSDLSIRSNQLTEVDKLSELSKLTSLDMRYNQISTIPDLSNLTELKTLQADGNQLTNLSGLRNLRKLQTLGLFNNQISEIESLSGVTSLTNLQIGQNKLTSLEGIESLTNLKTFHAQSNQIADFSPLRSLSSITNLSINNQSPVMSVSVKNNKIANPFVNKDGSYMTVSKPPQGVQLSDDLSEIIFDNPEIGKTYNFTASGSGVVVNAKITINGIAVEIADEKLEEAIRETLKKPTGEITRTDLESLTRLVATNKGITDLTGLEYAINLERLQLEGNKITDLTPLSDLTRLNALFLFNNQITNVEPLKELTGLTELWLYGNKIIDISPLQSLTDLRTLGLSGNKIEDISPLSYLTKLSFLNLSDNQIKDMEPLVELNQLTTLNLNNNKITEVPSLTKMTSLERLELVNNQITTIGRVELPVLKRLYLSRNQITDISGLSGLTQLTHLEMFMNQIKTIEPLRNLVNLQELWFYSNQISDIQWVENMVELRKLGASDNQIEDISSLKLLTKLNFLNLSTNKIKDFSIVQNLTNVQTFDYKNQQIELVVPQGYTKILNPMKDVNGNFIPLIVPNGQMSDDNQYIILNLSVAGEVIQAEITDTTYRGKVVIKVVDNLPTPNIKIEQIKVGLGDKELHITVENEFYATEKIILPDGSEVLGNEATFTATQSGEYTIKAYDIAGNEFIETVNVVVTRPIVTMNQAPIIEAQDIIITQGDKFNALDYVSAIDHEDDDSTLKIEVVSDTVDTDNYGIYEVTYKVTDSQGASSTKTIKVTVNPKLIQLNHAPVIEANNMSIFVGYKIDLLSLVTATDKEDGKLNARIVSSNFDNTKVGTYHVVYEVVDSQGAKAMKVVEIIVREPLTGGNGNYTRDIVIKPNENLDIKSVVNEVAKDKGLTDIEIIENNIKEEVEGDYRVIFEGTNEEGEREVHQIKVTIKKERQDDVVEEELSKEENEELTDDKKPSSEIETGIQTGTLIGLGGILSIVGLPLLKRKRK